MQIEIRKAQRSDRDAIVGFQIEMAWETERCKLDLATVIKGVEAVLGNEHLGSYYVAIVKNEVVGSLLTTYEWSDWRNGTVLWIQSVYVDPETFKLRKIRMKDPINSRNLSIDFSDFNAIQKQLYPGAIDLRFVSPESSIELNVKLSGFSMDEENEIHFRVPEKYTRINME